MNTKELKIKVCQWAVKACQTGLFEGTCGNLSAYDREQNFVVITPSGLPYDQYTPENMVVIDLEGNVLEGAYKPSSEWIMHTMVYREKPEVNAVLHTHSPYASSFAVRNEGVPCILVEMLPTIGGDIPLAKFGMPGTDEVGREAVKALKGRGGCLLANHGVLAVGADLGQAFDRAGFVPGQDFVLGLDAASSEWVVPSEEGGEPRYTLPKAQLSYTTGELISHWEGLCAKYPIRSIEDPLGENDWQGFVQITHRLGSRVQIVGDDLFVTNPKRIAEGVAMKAANAVLIKPNQIGTLTQTLEAVRLAQQAGYRTILSHRSGETEDSTIADIAVACGAGQIKTGAPCRGERTAKYNQLLRIEEELGNRAAFPNWC